MNWIEIDKILYGIISRHENQADMLKEARTQFKWSQSQAEAALLPLLKRHTLKFNYKKDSKKPPKKLTSNKKKV